MGGVRRSGGWRVIGVLLLVSLLMVALGGAPSARAAQITVPAGDVSALISAINTANANPDTDAIVLAAEATYTLTAVDNTNEFGPTGLPQITSPITIIGNGATITRSSTAPSFRIMSVAVGATFTLQQVTVSNGTTTSDGGGILNHGTLTLADSTVSGNSAVSAGGILNRGTMTLTNSTVSGNSAFNGGGGMINSGIVSRLTLVNTTVSGNNASHGGGIYNTNSGVVILTNSTFTGNSASSHGGGILNNASLVPTNSIVAGNTAQFGLDILGTAYGSFNLIGDGSGTATMTHGTDGNRVGTNQAPIDPRLGPLADNGGPTQTHLPGLDSQAIDAADTSAGPTADQRGVSRPYGDASDIGAVEVQTHTELCTLTRAKVRQASVVRSACVMLGIAQVADQQGNPTLEQVALTSYQLQIRSAQMRRYVSAADAAELIVWSKLL